MTELLPIEDLDKGTRRLVRLALKARKRAYAPYSKYTVGCAILDNRNKIHTGCNIETDSFLATVCAERVAILKMLSRGGRECRKVVVVTEFENPTFPCGVCRQVIYEFGKRAIIYAVGGRGTVFQRSDIGELFPYSYAVEDLRV